LHQRRREIIVTLLLGRSLLEYGKIHLSPNDWDPT